MEQYHAENEKVYRSKRDVPYKPGMYFPKSLVCTAGPGWSGDEIADALTRAQINPVTP